MENNLPLISLIIPVYNVEPYLSSCLDSIINQSYQNLEIILVNDGSTDGSRFLCEQYKQKDSRIILINQKNQGLSSARNTGINSATGKYLSFIDSDDEVKKDYVKKLYSALKKSSANISVCGYNETVPKLETLSGTAATVRLLTHQENLDLLAWNKLYKKDLFVKNKIFYPVGKVHEDNLTTYKLYSKAEKVAFVPESLYVYRERKGSITKNSQKEAHLKIRELSAREALDFFKGNETLTTAAEISLLLAQFAWLDNALKNTVPKKYESKTLLWLKTHQKSYYKNQFLTKKLKLYLLLSTNFSGKPYKLFRKLKP